MTVSKPSAFQLAGKQIFTRLTRFKLVQRAMRFAVRIVVPSRRIGACAVVFNEHDEVLLLHHVFHGNYPWGLPGGWLNRHELPNEAARRELKEETGLSADLGDLILLTKSPPGHSIDMYFYASNPRGTVFVSGEINQAKWVSPTDLPYKLLPRNRQAIKLAYEHHHQLQTRKMAIDTPSHVMAQKD